MYYDLSLTPISEWFNTEWVKPVIITASSINELKQKSKVKGLTILHKPSPKIMRSAVEKSLVDAVLPDRVNGRDYMHHPRTMLDNVMLKFMSKNHVSLIFSFSELLRTKGVKRAIVWGRMVYEMSLCIKKNVPVIVCSLASNEEELVHYQSLLSIAELLGLNPQQAKNALRLVYEKVLERDK